MRLVDCERIHQRERVGDEQVEGVAAGRCVAGAVPALIVAQHAERTAELACLLIPHGQIGRERIAQDEPGRAFRTVELIIDGDAVRFDLHDEGSLQPARCRAADRVCPCRKSCNSASSTAALEAGVLTIEHGTYLDDECCDAMRESGAILVPTRTIIEDMLAYSAGVPGYAMTKLRGIADVHAEAVARARERGVTIAAGTDIALTGMELPNSWGHNGKELAHLVDLGMTPLQAIEAATATAPATLGRQAPRSGLLAAGYDADVITVDADPLADISVLAKPAHVTAVWTAGRQVKGAAPG